MTLSYKYTTFVLIQRTLCTHTNTRLNKRGHKLLFLRLFFTSSGNSLCLSLHWLSCTTNNNNKKGKNIIKDYTLIHKNQSQMKNLPEVMRVSFTQRQHRLRCDFFTSPRGENNVYCAQGKQELVSQKVLHLKTRGLAYGKKT